MSAKKNNASKASKIRDLSLSDIQVELNKSHHELLDLKIRKASGQVENPLQIRRLRRNIARMTTIAAEKQTAAKA